LWLVDYNYQRIQSKGIQPKGLASISASNIELILFSITSKLKLTPEIFAHLQDYLGQIVYHNNLIADSIVLLQSPTQPNSGVWVDPRNLCLNEIAGICTPDPTYKDRPEPSLRARMERLLQEIEKIKS
jgi:hypothetical protein